MSLNKDEKYLKEKIEKDLPIEFDQKIFTAREYKNYFVNRTKKSNSLFSTLTTEKMSWAIGFSFSVFFLFFISFTQIAPNKLDDNELLTMTKSLEILEDFEMLEEIDEEMMELSNEDWDVLLADN